MPAEVKERHRRVARAFRRLSASRMDQEDALAEAFAHAEADALERAVQECERMAQSWCIRLNEQDWLPNVASASENTAYELADRIRALKEAP